VDGARVYAQEITYRVRVFVAVDAMMRGAARIELRRGRAINRGLEIGDDVLVGRLVGPRQALRRHRPCTELPDHLLEGLGIGSGILDVRLVELEAGRFQLTVVAADTIRIDNLAVVRRRRFARDLLTRGGHVAHTCESHAQSARERERSDAKIERAARAEPGARFSGAGEHGNAMTEVKVCAHASSSRSRPYVFFLML